MGVKKIAIYISDRGSSQNIFLKTVKICKTNKQTNKHTIQFKESQSSFKKNLNSYFSKIDIQMASG